MGRFTIIEYKAGWAPEPVWTTWRREKSYTYRGSKFDLLAVQPVASRYPGSLDIERVVS
jgi:hypothetical protein